MWAARPKLLVACPAQTLRYRIDLRSCPLRLGGAVMVFQAAPLHGLSLLLVVLLCHACNALWCYCTILDHTILLQLPRCCGLHRCLIVVSVSSTQSHEFAPCSTLLTFGSFASKAPTSLVLSHTTYPCAFKPGCLTSHNWLHTLDCTVVSENIACSIGLC